MPVAAPRPVRLDPPATIHWQQGERWLTLAVAPLDWDTPERLLARLTIPERARLATLHHGPRRDEYLAGHALLNALLLERGKRRRIATEAGRPPRAEVDGRRVAVSLSHAGGLAAAAAGNLRHLGLDLEFERPGTELRRAAERFGWPPIAGPSPLVRSWTLWEAAGKARGQGVFRGADAVARALLEGAAGRPRREVRAGGFRWLAWRVGDGSWLALVRDDVPLGAATLNLAPRFRAGERA